MISANPKLLIDAVYISSGGGLVLLNYLMQELTTFDIDIHLLLDTRNTTNYPILHENKITRIRPSLLKRHQFYINNINNFVIVFTINNLPPTVPVVSARVYTYFHQYLFLDHVGMNYGLKDRLFLGLKKIFISRFINNTDQFIVQTQNVKDKFVSVFKIDSEKILVLPFYEDNYPVPVTQRTNSVNHYVYISDGYPHKNHGRLLRAWEIVNATYPEAKLTLTISEMRFPELYKEIEEYKNKGVNVMNAGPQNKNEVIKLYTQNRFLIYPSLAESFGLVLIEAVHYGCEIIAADLDYVRSVVIPMLVFDPMDPKNIAEKILESRRNSGDKHISKPVVENKISELLQVLTTRKDY